MATDAMRPQRTQQVEGHGGRPGHGEIAQGVAIAPLQRTLAQHAEQLRRIGLRGGADVEFGGGKAGNASFQLRDRGTGKIALPVQREAVADEAQVGLDLLHRRPVRLKADHAIADLPERFEAPVVIVERPIVQIAADQASAAGDGTAGDGHVEPVDGGLAHL